jgi:hypothetical protein
MRDTLSLKMDPKMRKKARKKPPSKPKIRKVEGGPVTTEHTEGTNDRQDRGISRMSRISKISPGPCPATAKDKEELIRIWDEDLCE